MMAEVRRVGNTSDMPRIAALSGCPVAKDARHGAPPRARIADGFADLVDPRIPRGRRHALLDSVTIAVCGVISGAESWVEVAQWARIKQDWLDRPHGIPAHDTFGRVFARIDPAPFEAGFLRWVQLVVTGATPEVSARAGKTVRRSGATRAPCTWSAPGPVPNAWCWRRKRSTARATRSRRSPPC